MKLRFHLNNDSLFSLLLFTLSVVLLLMPNGFEKAMPANSLRARAKILETDNSLINQHGIVRTGGQKLTMRIESTVFRGTVIEGHNHLLGKMDMDKIFKPGDLALVVINSTDGGKKVANVTVIDHYRIHLEIILFLMFFAALVIVAGKTGLKAMLTFVFTVLYLWKILLPAFLKSLNPVAVSVVSVLILTGVIIFSIAGFSRRGLSAFCGSAAGVLVTCLLSVLFGNLFIIHGAVMPFSEPLLYTGFSSVNLTGIFHSGVFIASSGVIMDVSMDIAAAMNEIRRKSPDISFRELAHSGLEVGRAVLGTMTTTLLLAYFGAYSTMFMLFIALGTPITNILNLLYVSAEIMHTLVGSFGMVTVIPFTALIGALIFTSKRTGDSDRITRPGLIDN